MKNNLLLIVCLLISVNLFAQVDRTKMPQPGPPPKIELGNYESFTLPNGLKVFIVENHKLPVISVSLILERDPILEGNKAGYVSIAGDLLGRGTKNRKKEQIDEEIDFIGASLSTSATGVFASSLKKHSNKLLELMSDVTLNPSFPAEELEKIKSQTLSSLAFSKDDPNTISGNVARALVYGKNHPYGEITTEETVKNITLQDCIDYYSKYFKPNIGYLAIVGDITKKEAEPLVMNYLGKWQSGDVPAYKYETPAPPKTTTVAIVDRPASVQSVIDLTYPVLLKPGEPDVIKSRVMNQILGGGFSSRLNMNLREKHGYTYGASSSIGPDKLVSNFSASASVRNEVTDSAVANMIAELKTMWDKKVTEAELRLAKNFISGGFARSLESPSTIAQFAINIARYNMPQDYYANYLKNVEAVTIDDVEQMAKKYISPSNSYILVVGKGEEVALPLKKYGPLQYYDNYGNFYDPSAKVIPANVTAENVIDNYIKALGGKEKLSKVKDVTTRMKMTMPGAAIEMTRIEKAPNKSLTVGKMGANEVMKMVFNGLKGYQSQMGQKQELSGKELEDAKIESTMFAELYYPKLGVKTKLEELVKIEGKDAYKLEVIYPSGTKVSQYYSTASGLKIKEEKIVETPQGPSSQITSIADYKEFSGIKFPAKITQSFGPQSFNIEVESVEVNKGLKDTVFEVK